MPSTALERRPLVTRRHARLLRSIERTRHLPEHAALFLAGLDLKQDADTPEQTPPYRLGRLLRRVGALLLGVLALLSVRLLTPDAGIIATGATMIPVWLMMAAVCRVAASSLAAMAEARPDTLRIRASRYAKQLPGPGEWIWADGELYAVKFLQGDRLALRDGHQLRWVNILDARWPSAADLARISEKLDTAQKRQPQHVFTRPHP